MNSAIPRWAQLTTRIRQKLSRGRSHQRQAVDAFFRLCNHCRDQLPHLLAHLGNTLVTEERAIVDKRKLKPLVLFLNIQRQIKLRRHFGLRQYSRCQSGKLDSVLFKIEHVEENLKQRRMADITLRL